MSAFHDVPKTITGDRLTDFVLQFRFALNAFGHQHDDPGAVCENRITGDFELIYVRSGENTVTVANTDYRCVAGEAVLIPPFTLHSIRTPAANPHDNYWLHFDVYPIYKQDDFIRSILPDGCHKINTVNMGRILELYDRMETESREAMPGNLAYCGALFVEIVILILRREGDLKLPSAEDCGRAGDIEIVNGCLKAIQDNISCPIGVDDLCRQLNISQSRLFKAFSRVVKESPNHFIQMFKIKKAEQLMKSTALSLKEISEAVAFSSPYYFSAVFKKFYRIPPRDYQRNLR